MNYKSHKGFARDRVSKPQRVGEEDSNSGREDFKDAANLKHAAHLRRVESMESEKHIKMHCETLFTIECL